MKSILCIHTTSCPNCPAVKEYLQTKVSGINIQLMDEHDKFFKKTCEDFEATSAPCILLFDKKMVELGRAHDVEGVKELLKKHEDAE
jgi:glutaredoxin